MTTTTAFTTTAGTSPPRRSRSAYVAVTKIESSPGHCRAGDEAVQDRGPTGPRPRPRNRRRRFKSDDEEVLSDLGERPHEASNKPGVVVRVAVGHLSQKAMDRVHEPPGLPILELVPDVPVELCGVRSREPIAGRGERCGLDQIGHRRVHGSMPR